jgi:hypothetical protein
VLERRTQILDTLIAAVDGGGDQTTSPLTAEGVVGAVFSVIHTCLSGQYSDPLIELSNPLTAMIVLPYLGHAAASRELARPTPKARRPTPRPKPAPEPATPRLGHRGPIILQVIATTPGLSNGAIAERVGLRDTGHISRLLLRLSDQGLIVNKSRGHPRGIKAWRVTEAGERAWREGLRPADGDSPILHR